MGFPGIEEEESYWCQEVASLEGCVLRHSVVHDEVFREYVCHSGVQAMTSMGGCS